MNEIRTNNKRVLLYYVVNIFLVLNMMLILFSSIIMLKSGEVSSAGLIKFFFNTLFFTGLTKGIIALILRLPKKDQLVMLFMSLIISIFIWIMSILTIVFNPLIILQLTLFFWSIYAILYNYIVLKNIKQYMSLVVLTSIYAFYTLSLFVILFMDIYKVFFDSGAVLTGTLSIIIVFISLEMLQLLAYVLIPEYYSKSVEIIDLFDEIQFKYEIRERDVIEQEEFKTKKIVERKMLERQRIAEREKERQERLAKRRKIKSNIRPLSKNRLDKHLDKVNKKKYKE